MTSSTYSVSNQDSTSYEDGYKVFLQRSDFREEVVKAFAVLAPAFSKNSKSLRVLDVGCGNGQMTKRYINELKKFVPEIHLTLLEPAQESLKDAAQLLESEVKSLKTKSHLENTTEFDLIIASYVFYHLTPETLDELLKILSPKGSLVIMMGTSNHPLKSHPQLKSISAHGSSDKLTPFIEPLRKSEKFKVHRLSIETKLDLNGLWVNKAFTEDAKILLSFSLNKNFHDLNQAALHALSEIFESAFTNGDGFLRPVHEIIRIERT